MSFRRYRWSQLGVVGRFIVAEPFFPKYDIAVRSDWGDGQEKRLLCGDGILQKAVCFPGKDIGRIFPFVADWSILVSLERGIEIFIRERVDKKVGPIEA